MYIRHIHIDNFGIFRDFDLDLEKGLNTFTWANESGKSTLVEFIRRIFWGFPDKRSKLNPYPALKGSGIYGGFLDVTMSSGEEVRLERRGERGKLKIFTADGNCETLENIGNLAGISENFYRNVCAITLSELTAFAALDDLEVRNRLYGNALSFGEVSLSDLHKKLTEKAEIFFKKRGSIHELKKLSAAFSESETRLAKLSENFPAYEKAVLEAESIEKQSASLKEELEQILSDIRHKEELLAVAEKRKKLADDEALFSKQPRPVPAPAPLVPFAIKAPQIPETPVFPELPLLPFLPTAPELEGKCDYFRAPQVTAADLQQAANLGFFQNRSNKNASFLYGAALLIVFVFAVFACMTKVLTLFQAALLLLCLAAFFAFLHRKKNRCNMAQFNSEKESIRCRFLIDSGVPAGEYGTLLAQLMEFQKAYQEYALHLEHYEEVKKKIETLNLEYELKCKHYADKKREYENMKHAYELQAAAHAAETRKAREELVRYESEKLALIKRRNELPPETSETAAREEVDDLMRRRDEINTLLEENFRRSGAERREAALLLEGKDSALELNVREQIRGKMRSAAEKYLVFTAARILLEKAVERYEREHQGSILQQTSHWFGLFTQGKYSRVYKQLEDNQLKVSGPGCEEGLTPGQLSTGTREQLFLALRLALIPSLGNEAEPLPVVLDDVLVNFDTDRKKTVLKSLEEFAKHHQVLLFECK